jgi:hypothetical protein
MSLVVPTLIKTTRVALKNVYSVADAPSTLSTGDNFVVWPNATRKMLKKKIESAEM